MTGEPYSSKLKPNTEAVYTRPFPVPQKHLNLMKDEVNHLIELGVLGQANDRIGSNPYSGILKKDKTRLYRSQQT